MRDKLIQEAAEANVNKRRMTSWTCCSNQIRVRERGAGGSKWKAAGLERTAEERVGSTECVLPVPRQGRNQTRCPHVPLIQWLSSKSRSLWFSFVKMSGLWKASFSKTHWTFFCSGLLLPVLLQPVISACLPLASNSSTFTFLLRKDFDGLDDGVPIKIILDVIGWHAMHLEVSRRYHVLLVHLCMMSWGGNRGGWDLVHNCVLGVVSLSPVMGGPVLLIGGMWGYPGGPIMDILCLESM